MGRLGIPLHSMRSMRTRAAYLLLLSGSWLTVSTALRIF
jgi:hypothetical protein